ncbi:MAG: GNAT family N-acetyltransferase [Alphaproteobacteria bacterium]|nr:GNAT family N-acetyltransferase [Alphaproteobacteria bacterium]MBL6939781.1 GNAT family N-acetyltransferase [Alphaproteobacteria bacterium]MBL7098234.1 GNAT family N-acetyltransferase [Alphaproteobacteria bacterium]
MGRPVCSTLSLTIRKAKTAAEIEDAAALYERSGTAAFFWRPVGHFQARDFIAFAQQEEVWLAYMSDALVGILSLFKEENFVHCLYVDPQAQGLGIGRALVDFVRKRIGKPLTLKLDVPNRKAIAFYDTTGWERMTGLDDQGIDDQGIKWARYRLS